MNQMSLPERLKKADSVTHAWVIESKSLIPDDSSIIHQVEPGISVHEWLAANVRNYREMDKPPVVCIYNGEELAPEHWRTVRFAAGDTCAFSRRMFGFDPISLAIMAVVAIAAAVVVVQLTPVPEQAKALNMPEASPTYSFEAQSNRARLMQPWPWAGGTNRHWPDLLSQPYYEYEGNEQFVYQLFSIGYGPFAREQLLIADTAADNFKEIEYAFYGPDDPVILFPDNVVTSTDVASIEMPDEVEDPENPVLPWFGPYTASAPGTKTYYLAVDVQFPQGIYYANDKGGLDSRSAGIEVQYQAIDDAGNAIGSWLPLVNDEDENDGRHVWTMATNTPQRMTIKREVDGGRYQVRARRAVHYSSRNSRLSDKTVWTGLRAYLPSKQEYRGVSKLAVKVQASNNIGQGSEQKFNFVGHALKEVWTGSGWGNRQRTDSIGWIFADAVRSEHGGRLPDHVINMDNLLGMHQVWESRGDKFSQVFDTKGTFFDTLKVILSAGRAVPILHNGQIIIVRDYPQMVRKHMYSPANMSRIKIDRQYVVSGQNDSVIVEYMDPLTWKPTEVLCQLPGLPANNPKRVKMLGIQDRAQAFREGCFIVAKITYRNVQVSGYTELDALNSTFGDMVGISADLPKWGQSGEVVRAGGMTIRTSEPVRFETGQHYVGLRREDGSYAGPYRCHGGDDDEYTLILDEKPDFPIYVGDEKVRTLYQFGTADSLCKNCVVTNISPSGDKVQITAAYDNPKVHSFDNLPVPPDDVPSDGLVRPVLPKILNFIVLQSSTSLTDIILSWLPEPGARSFVLDQSSDGFTWERLATPTYNTYIAKNVPPGLVYYRVAAIGGGQGEWAQDEIEAGRWLLSPDPVKKIELIAPWTDNTINFSWTASARADEYLVEIVHEGSVIKSTETEMLTGIFVVPAPGLDEDGLPVEPPIEQLTIRVTALNTVGESSSISLEVEKVVV